MARQSYRNQPIEPEKMDIPEAPEAKKEKSMGKVKTLKIQIHGSITIWSMRYEGIQEWAENDPRLIAAKGDYTIIGEY